MASCAEREAMTAVLCARVECQVTVVLCARVECAMMVVMVVLYVHIEREQETGVESLKMKGSKSGSIDVEPEARCLYRCQSSHHVRWQWVHRV